MSEFNQLENSPFIHRSWLSGSEKDADFELTEHSTLPDLRRIAQRLIKQNWIAAGAQQAYVNMVMGGRIIINVRGNHDIDSELDEKLKAVDLDGSQSLSAIISRLVMSAFTLGDCLVLRCWDGKREYVDLVEAGRIRTPSDLANDSNVREGVKYKKGRQVGCYVRQLVVNPMDMKNRFNNTSEDYKYYPFFKKGERVAYLFKAPLNLRPNQTRQYPVMTPLFNLLRYIDSLLEYTLVGTMVAASFSVFIRSKNPDGTRDALEKQNQTGLKKVGQLSPGQVWYLNGASEGIEFASPNKPSDNTDQFLRRLFRMVSMTLRMPYETLFLDLADSNYASFKSGLLEVRRSKQRWDDALSTVVDWLVKGQLQDLWAKGAINKEPKSLDLDIVMPKLGTIDDEKEARADRLNINQNGTKSRRMAINEHGNDFDAVQDQLTEEALLAKRREAEVLKLQKELSEEYGIVFPDANADGGDYDPASEENKDNRKDDGNW